MTEHLVGWSLVVLGWASLIAGLVCWIGWAGFVIGGLSGMAAGGLLIDWEVTLGEPAVPPRRSQPD